MPDHHRQYRPQAYREGGRPVAGELRPAEPAGKPPITLKRIGAGILDALIGTMSPLIPAIIGGSMVAAGDDLREMTGALPKGAPTLTILTVIGDGAFFFLPLMVAGFRGGEVQKYVAGDCGLPGCWCTRALSS